MTKMGRPKKWPGPTRTMQYKAPETIADKVDAIVVDLKNRGFGPGKANKSYVQLTIVEKGIDEAKAFFSQEVITR